MVLKLPGKLLRSPFSYTSVEVDPLVPLPTKSFQCTAQKIKLFTKDFLSQCKYSFLRIYLHLLKKLLVENSVFLCSEATWNFSLKGYLWSAFIKVFIIKDTPGQMNSSISNSRLLPYLMVKITKWYKKIERNNFKYFFICFFLPYLPCTVSWLLFSFHFWNFREKQAFLTFWNFLKDIQRKNMYSSVNM